jgi:uncharacterized SAM-binding protein YcdF (DUF218 family)
VRRFFRTLGALVLAAFLLGCVWLGGLVWFAVTMAKTPTSNRTPTDVIVVLTGGEDRLAEGVRLLSNGYAKWLFVSGVHPGVRKKELMRVAGVEDARIANFVLLGKRAADTRGNATESAALVRERKFRSLRLVTANYHMRRSLVEFHRALPNTTVIANPVFPRPVNPGPWWHSRRAISIVVGEYNKYLVALTGTGAQAP